MDKFVSVSHNSYGSRIKNSFAGIIVGIIFFFGSFVLLWWNEGNSARLIKQANYLEKTAIPVTSESIDRANDNKIISTNGTLTTTENLYDENISMKNALVLDRKVEMYQWDEDKDTKEKDNFGGSSTTTTTYTYRKVWNKRHINSSRFAHREGHENPEFPIDSKRFNASSGNFGAFTLTEMQTNSINKLITLKKLPENNKYIIADGKYYSSKNTETPEIGDIRITYSYAPSGTKVSAIGEQQSNNTISEAHTEYGNVYLQSDGLISKHEVVKEYKDMNNLITWILRFAGWLFMLIGLMLMMKPMIIIAKFIPPLAAVLEFFSGFIMFIVSIILSLTTIAIAWLAYRPFLAAFLICIIAGLIYLLVKYIGKKKQEKAIQDSAYAVQQ